MTSTDPVSTAPSSSWLAALQARLGPLGRSRRVRVGGLSLLGAVVLFGLLGYFWLPGFLHGRIEQALTEALERPVSLGKIEVQPYVLKATVRDLRIGNREGDDPLAGFSALTVNVSSASLWRRALVLDALRLEGPYFNLVRQADGRTNISDLQEKFAGGEPQEETPPTPFAINNLEVVGGQLGLDDRGQRHEITELHLGLPRVASFPGEVERQVQPHFSAILDGAPINLEGELRPFADTPDGKLRLRFEGLDLARLASFSPAPLPVNLGSAKLDSDLTLDFSVGEASRFALQGRLALRDLQASRNPVSLGMKSLELQVQGDDLVQAPIRLQGIALRDLQAQRQGEAKPFLSLAGFNLDQLLLDSGKRQVEIGQIGLDGLALALARVGEGQLDLLDTLARLQDSKGAAKESPAAVQPATAATGEAAAPWGWRLAGVQLQAGRFSFVDNTVAKAVPLTVSPLAVKLGALASTGGQPVEFSLDSRLNEQGRIQVAGRVDPLAPAGDLTLDLDALDLVPLQGWLPQHFNLLLTKGNLSTAGQVRFGGQPLAVSFKGGAQLADLAVLERDGDRALLRWQKLELSGLDVDTAPFHLKLDDIVLNRFFARLLVTPEGELQLDRLLRGDKPKPEKTAAAPVSPEPPQEAVGKAEDTPPTAAVAPRQEPVPVEIGRIRLEQGTVIFNDQFIKPSYTANLSGMSGQLGPLAAGKRGKLSLQGKVDRSAPLVITGELEPFSRELFLDVKAQARGIDMPSFSPYSGRYLGYLIQKGKLSVDVRYHIEQGLLEAENHIFLDQFTLGDQVESPDAVSLPINLALALLKNSRGEIDINLPISGSLNDPQFSIGGIVWKAILNLLTKAATSPFTLLGSMFGGGEELSYAEFPPGRSNLEPEGIQRLEKLAKALLDRPSLSLEVTGQADPVADSEGYRRVLLERQVRARKVAADVAQGKSAANMRDVQLTPQEYEKFLTQVYKDAKFDKPRNVIGLTKGLPVSEMETLLITHMKVDEDGFRDLATRRAQGVRDWLVEQGGVPTERVFVMGPELGKQEPGAAANRVVFSLR